MRSAAMLCGGFLAHVIIKVIYLLISLMAIVTTIITRTAREWRTFNSPARHISSGDIISLFITPKGRARPGDGPSGVSECVIRLCGKVHSLWRAHSLTPSNAWIIKIKREKLNGPNAGFSRVPV